MGQDRHAAWACADPGLQFDTTINEWHTCPARWRINASNPCSEYMFLDDTACNLASLNLMTFRQRTVGSISPAMSTRFGCGPSTLEIAVLMAQFPSKEIAQLSYEFRTLGLGYANIGGLLMAAGHVYDSDEGRAICGALTAIMTGVSYATSAEMAGELGPFPRYKENRDAHAAGDPQSPPAAHGEAEGYEGLTIRRCRSTPNCPDTDLTRRLAALGPGLALGEQARLPQCPSDA